MASRPFRLEPGHCFAPCPRCGNQVEFIARAERCAEDCCEVWVECAHCGHDPTRDAFGHRLEDVWGSLDAETIHVALVCREEALTAAVAGSPSGGADLEGAEG